MTHHDRSFDEILASADVAGVPQHVDPGLDLSEALAELATIDLRTDDLARVLQRIAQLAQKSLAGVDEVSVSLVGGDDAVTPAFTGPMAISADEMQYANDGGPCIDAARSGQPVLVADVATEQRWPGYIPRAAQAGVGSMLSVPLPLNEAVTGALNLYSRRPHTIDEETLEAAQAFAGYAAVAVANAQLYETTAALARQMQDAMASRAVIEQAKGLIMGQRRCSADEAFQLLAKVSMNSNRKLRDVAAELIASVHRRP